MALSITPRLIIEAATKRGWKVRIIDEKRALYRLDVPNEKYYYIRNLVSIKDSEVNATIATHKDIFALLAKELDLVMPDTMLYEDDSDTALAFLSKHQTLVVKPTNQSHGNGVTIDISTQAQLQTAIAYARQFSQTLLLQQQIEGEDYRVLLIDGKLAAAAIREPAFVIGDGIHTTDELITIENATDGRGAGYNDVLTHIDIEAAERYLGDKRTYVPGKDEKVRVVGTANIGKGGVSIDITDELDPTLLEIAQKIVNHFGMGICGVDFLVTADGKPYLIEVNTSPSLGLHENPFRGKSRKTPDLYLNWLTA